MRQLERFVRLSQELDEVAVVPRRNVHQPRMRRADVRLHGRLEQRLQRRPIQRQVLHVAARHDVAAAVAVMVMVVVVVVMVLRQVAARVRDARRRHRAPPQNVRQHGRALHVLRDQRYHLAQLFHAQRVAQAARPVNVVDGRMRVLVHRKLRN